MLMCKGLINRKLNNEINEEKHFGHVTEELENWRILNV